MEKVVIKRYSTAFKQQIVAEYEKGGSIRSMKQKYGINGNGTIERWVREHSRKGLRHRYMIIQKPEEQDEVKALKEKIARLEKVVADLTLDKFMLETTLAVVEEELGVEAKKDGGPGSSNRPTDKVENEERL